MGEKFNAPDPGATQPTTADEAGQRNAYKFRNDSPQADDAKSVDSYMKLKNENAKSVDSYMKLENARSDPGPGPDAASSKTSYDVKKNDRI